MPEKLIVPLDLLQRLERLNVMARRYLSARGIGKRESRNKGASLEFQEYRHYVAGDELRYLDWNVYARHGSLFIKQFAAEENVHVAVLLDCSASMGFGRPSKLEIGKLLAVSFGYIALANLDLVSVWKFHNRISAVRSLLAGKARIHELIHSLESVQAEGESSFAAALSQPLPRLKGKSVAIVISDFYDIEGYSRALLHLLGQKIQVDLIQVLTRDERDPPLEGRIVMKDAETSRSGTFVVSPRALEAYRARFQKFLEDLDAFAASREIRLLRVFTDEPLESVIARSAHSGFLERV